MPQISISDFRFIRNGYGHYFVTYTSQITGKEWQCLTNNMPLIDCTKNTETPLKTHLNELKRLCKKQ